jgi:DNA methyltransferase 1-associated protein 1
MSSSDIRDILQLGPAPESVPKRAKPASEKRPGKLQHMMKLRGKINLFLIEGISRELYSLIGGAPPVAFVKPTYKAKLQPKKKATPW